MQIFIIITSEIGIDIMSVIFRTIYCINCTLTVCFYYIITLKLGIYKSDFLCTFEPTIISYILFSAYKVLLPEDVRC